MIEFIQFPACELVQPFLEHFPVSFTEKRFVRDGFKGTVYFVKINGQLVLYYCLEVNGKEAWITAAYGKMRGVSLIDTVLPLIERQALEKGCSTLGAKTVRKGLKKKLLDCGYKLIQRSEDGDDLEKALV